MRSTHQPGILDLLAFRERRRRASLLVKELDACIALGGDHQAKALTTSGIREPENGISATALAYEHPCGAKPCAAGLELGLKLCSL